MRFDFKKLQLELKIGILMPSNTPHLIQMVHSFEDKMDVTVHLGPSNNELSQEFALDNLYM